MEIGPKIHYAGFIFSENGCFPGPAKVIALKEFPELQDMHNLRVFLGLNHHMLSFMPGLSHATKRLRELFKKGVEWHWLPEHSEDFNTVKDLMSDTNNLVAFSATSKTRLITDASRQGIGWILLQQTEEGDWRIVRAGSAALGPAQRNYPAILLELLGVAHAMEKCDFYLRGAPRFELMTDHAPLKGLFRKDLWDNSPKLQPLVERTGRYSFVTTHC